MLKLFKNENSNHEIEELKDKVAALESKLEASEKTLDEYTYRNKSISEKMSQDFENKIYEYERKFIKQKLKDQEKIHKQQLINNSINFSINYCTSILSAPLIALIDEIKTAHIEK